MIVYMVMFAIPLLGMALSATGSRPVSRVAWFGAGLALVVIIGTRQYVGADWENYELQFYANVSQNLIEAWQSTDIAYATISWLVYRSGLEIYGLNLICAAILVAGVMTLASRQQDPWVALAIAVPYALLVVGMGYTRQSAALGLACFALLALSDRRLVRFAIFSVAAVLFHKSAIVLLPLAMVASTGRPMLTGLVLVVTAVVGSWFAAYSADFDVLRSTYVDQRLSSDGTAARLMIAAVAAVGFMLTAQTTTLSDVGKRVFWALALSTILLSALAWTGSTVVDRLALYVIPLQLVFWGNLSRAVSPAYLGFIPKMIAVLAYGAYMYLWLANSFHAFFWTPYNSFLPLGI